MKKKLDLEALFLSALGSDKKLHWYLENNISLVDYIYSVWPGHMAMIDLTLAVIPKSKRREMLKDFNLRKILDILKRQRPDIYNILIKHRNGVRWLESQIVVFRRKFL